MDKTLQAIQHSFNETAKYRDLISGTVFVDRGDAGPLLLVVVESSLVPVYRFDLKWISYCLSADITRFVDFSSYPVMNPHVQYEVVVHDGGNDSYLLLNEYLHSNGSDAPHYVSTEILSHLGYGENIFSSGSGGEVFEAVLSRLQSSDLQ